jgi:hypothetical protein
MHSGPSDQPSGCNAPVTGGLIDSSVNEQGKSLNKNISDRRQAMWIFTDVGFFSIVQKRDTDFLTVRARVAGDLDRLREKYMPELSGTKATPRNDYPFRANIGHEAFAAGLAAVARNLNYDNFKNHVAKTMGYEREDVYHNVWATLLQLQR